MPEGNQTKKRRTRGSLNRKEILDASLQIIQTEGIEKLSMRRIAANLGCSVASPYAYFENQAEIIKELILIGESQLTENLKKARSASADVFEQLRAIAHTYWDFGVKNRELHKLMFSGGSGTIYRKAFPSLPTSYRVFLDTLRYGINSGQVCLSRQRYSDLAMTMWSWMYGLILLDMSGMMRVRANRDPVESGIGLFTEFLRSGDPDKMPDL